MAIYIQTDTDEAMLEALTALVFMSNDDGNDALQDLTNSNRLSNNEKNNLTFDEKVLAFNTVIKLNTNVEESLACFNDETKLKIISETSSNLSKICFNLISK